MTQMFMSKLKENMLSDRLLCNFSFHILVHVHILVYVSTKTCLLRSTAGQWETRARDEDKWIPWDFIIFWVIGLQPHRRVHSDPASTGDHGGGFLEDGLGQQQLGDRPALTGRWGGE